MHITIYAQTFLVISWFFTISLQMFNFVFANRFLSFLFYFIITHYVIIISMIFSFIYSFFYSFVFLFYQLFDIRGCCIDIERVHDWCVETCLVKDPSQQVRLPILSLLQHFISISLYWWLFVMYNFFLFYLIFFFPDVTFIFFNKLCMWYVRTAFSVRTECGFRTVLLLGCHKTIGR